MNITLFDAIHIHPFGFFANQSLECRAILPYHATGGRTNRSEAFFTAFGIEPLT